MVFVADDFGLLTLRRSGKAVEQHAFIHESSKPKEMETVKEKNGEKKQWNLRSRPVMWKVRDKIDYAVKVRNAHMAVQVWQERQALILCNRKGEVQRLLR